MRYLGLLLTTLLPLLGQLRRASLILGAITIASGLLVTAIRQPSANFSISGEATELSLQLASAAETGSWPVKQLHLSGTGTATCNGLPLALDEGLFISASEKGKPVQIIDLELAAKVRIRMSRTADQLKMVLDYPDGGAEQSSVAIQVPAEATGDACAPKAGAKTCEIVAAVRPGEVLEINMVGVAADEQLVELLPISRIDFIAKLKQPNGDYLQSGTIRSGSLWIDNTGFREPPLGPLDGIHAGRVADGMARNLTISQTGISIIVAGRAQELSNLQVGRARDLRPTLFDQLSKWPALRFILAALTLLAGIQVGNLLKRKD